MPPTERSDEQEEEDDDDDELLLFPGDKKLAKGMFSLFSGSSGRRTDLLLLLAAVLLEWRRIRLGMLVMLDRGVSAFEDGGNSRSGGLGVELLDSLSIERRR